MRDKCIRLQYCWCQVFKITVTQKSYHQFRIISWKRAFAVFYLRFLSHDMALKRGALHAT